MPAISFSTAACSLGSVTFGSAASLKPRSVTIWLLVSRTVVFDHLGHRRAAVEALEVRDRHLAGAKAVDADAVLQLVQALIDLGVEFGGRNDHLEFALEAFGQCFGYLHDHTLRLA